MSGPQRHTVIGIGELLWDLLPTGRQVGGAVVNLVYHVTRLGDRGVCLSRVGTDQPGADLVARLEQLGVDCAAVQSDPDHATGTVAVELAGGQPTYTIFEQVAYDFLELSERWLQLAAGAAAVCFGTLAQRTAPGRAAIAGFLGATGPDTLRLFDVNLRQQHWSTEVLDSSLRLATAVKLSDEGGKIDLCR